MTRLRKSSGDFSSAAKSVIDVSHSNFFGVSKR